MNVIKVIIVIKVYVYGLNNCCYSNLGVYNKILKLVYNFEYTLYKYYNIRIINIILEL